MRGLLEKDFCLMKKRKNYFLMLFLIMGMLGFVTDGTFFISGYLPIIVVMLTISTISYDEFDNGMAFLMTLPVKPKTYAVEKYVLGILMGACSVVLAIVVQIVVTIVQGMPLNLREYTEGAVFAIPMWSIMMAILFPIEMKFGAEKGRIALVLVYGVCFALFAMGRKLFALLGINAEELTAKVDAVPDTVMVAVLILISVFALLVSMLSSTGIMEKKEF